MGNAQSWSPSTGPSPDPASLSEEIKDLKALRQDLRKQIEQAEASNGLSETQKLLLRDSKEVYLNVEDVLDEWEYEQLLRAKIEGGSPNMTADPELWDRMADQIRKVKRKLEKVSVHGMMIHGEGDVRQRSQPVGRAPSSSLLGDDHDHKVRIVHYLVHKCPEDVTVFPILGLGLAGKTTLARAVYNDPQVKEHFSTGWASSGGDSDPKALLRCVIEALTSTACPFKELEQILQTLRGSVKDKRLFLVLDDLHPQHLRDWDLLKDSVFSSCSKRSVVVVTTRDRKVAEKVKTIQSPLYLEFKLSDDECWGLFKRYASDGNHPVMEDLREKVVEQCQGLPLAAKLLGISFRHHRGDKIDWADDCMDWVIEENIRPVLKSSYLELAPRLKPCLLYSSLFPQGYQFSKEQMVRLWMAQGLVEPPPKRETPWKRRRLDQEDEGLQNFDELVSGSFIIQDPEDWTQYSIPKLIWDLLNDISGEEEYVRRADMCDPLCKCRHLLLNPKDGSFRLDPDSFFDSPGLRSLIFMPRIKLRLEILDQDLSSLKRLRSLDLSNTSVTTLPESVGGLKHLRFLALNHTGITELPESVSKLYNLQVLELKNCYWLEKLPSGLGNLVNLRYLDTGDDRPRVNMPKGIQKLVNLQRLAGLDLQKGKELCGLRELKALSKLTELGVSGLCNLVDSEDAKEASMQDKKSLKVLKLNWCSDDDDAAAKSEQFKGTDYEKFYNLRDETDAGDNQTAHEGHPVVEEHLSAWIPGDYSDTLSGVADEDEDKNFTESAEEDISGLGSILRVVGAEQLLEALKPYTNIEELELRTLPCLHFPGWIGDPSFSKLITVVLEDCACEALPPLGQLPQLEFLSIDGTPVKAVDASFCKGLGSRAAAAFPNLLMLTFYNMRKWEIWDGVEKGDFPMLKELRLFNCPELRSLPESGSGFPSLLVLEIDRCRGLSKIPCLPSLTSLELCRCDSLTSIPSLGSLSSLTVVDCRSLGSVPPLERLVSLWVEECERLSPIAASSFLHTSSAERPKKLLVAYGGQLVY
ncbi:unnamed protein product [Spirodela intermedia]|uniref:Uncharacterized protein n=1 Tax=Spirodela intermedia TaxID=51605 RepID=A0A7I8L7C2_SPIIN|nr:unnamed protein product [Spirodela intermedia]